MLLSLALVLAPVPLSPSRLKDAMAKLDGALKSLDTDSAEKEGALAVNIMRSTSEQSNALQPAPEPAVLLSSMESVPLQSPPAGAAEELAPMTIVARTPVKSSTMPKLPSPSQPPSATP